MTTSVVFSSVFFIISLNELSKQFSDDGSLELGTTLIILNIVTLAIGIALSYWFTQRVLRPIEKMLEKQDQYIADASHGIRTPLASTLISNEIALKNSGLTLVQARAIIQGNIKDMQDLRLLSDELLQESENQSNMFNLTIVDTRKVVQEAVQRLTVIADDKKTFIKDNTSSIKVSANADVLRKVLVILIENAIKYSPAHSTITLTNHQSQSTVDILVTDQGIGIDAVDLDDIFNRFYRTDYSRSQAAGYGVGLSIAKKLLEKIDGKLSAKSILGSGSQFIIKLPANTSDSITAK